MKGEPFTDNEKAQREQKSKLTQLTNANDGQAQYLYSGAEADRQQATAAWAQLLGSLQRRGHS